MPLQKGKSKKVLSENIGELMHGYKEKGMIGTSHPSRLRKAMQQAAAIAYQKRKSK